MDLNLKACSLGIEFGSTRIKAVLIGPDYVPLASGSYTWKDHLEGQYWSYSLSEVKSGLQSCYAALKKEVKEKYGATMNTVGAIGISAMMHGYLPFDEKGRLLTPFRTWRNTTTAEASEKLTELFSFNIPQRWSISHLYQAILNKEEHVKDIRYLTTLAGYVHYELTGSNVLGVGDASGMFPIDSESGTYDAKMVKDFNELTGMDVVKILPKVLMAGEDAGALTREGSLLLDPDGDLEEGIPLAPPEGDAGTGMSATNAVRERTGNVSAGTSIFSMVVLEKMLKRVHTEIDLVTTPSGKPVAMVHCNNCTTDMNSYVSIIQEAVELMGGNSDLDEIYRLLYKKCLEGDLDAGAFTVYNYISGEPVVGLNDGKPVIVRRADRPAKLSDFVRAHLYSAFAALAYGMSILQDEGVKIDRLMGHGGLFRHPVTGAKFLSSAVNAPVYTMKTAGEGGPYGMALLAAYRVSGGKMSLEDFLESEVFRNTEGERMDPVEKEVEGFKAYLDRFIKGLEVEKAAIASF